MGSPPTRQSRSLQFTYYTLLENKLPAFFMSAARHRLTAIITNITNNVTANFFLGGIHFRGHAAAL